MNNPNFTFDSNRFLFHPQPWQFLKQLQQEKDAIIITCFTKLDTLLKINLRSPLVKLITELFPEYQQNLINEDYLKQMLTAINKQAKTEVVSPDLNVIKLLKLLVSICDKYMSVKEVLWLVAILEKYQPKVTRVFLFGFGNEVNTLLDHEHKNVTIFRVVNNLPTSGLKWKSIEQLVVYNVRHEPTIIYDQDRFRSFLEAKTNLAITAKTMNDFLSNRGEYQAFLIHQALQTITEDQ